MTKKPSSREIQVVARYVDGLTHQEIASDLSIGIGTVKTYLRRAKAKWNDAGRPTYSRADVVARAREDGIS